MSLSINFFSFFIYSQLFISSTLLIGPDHLEFSGNKVQLLKVKKDSTIAIKLKSLSTSGYQWHYSIRDSSVVNVEEIKTEFPTNKPIRVGDSGFEIFVIRGLKIGKTKISFVQKRPWKNGGSPVHTKNYMVIVE